MGRRLRVPLADFGVPFVTPKIEFDDLIPSRAEPGPAFDVPTAEVIDFLVEVASRLELEKNEYLQESLEMTVKVSALPRRIIENTFRRPGQFLTRQALEYRLERVFGGADVLDGWVERTDYDGRVSRIRAFRRDWFTYWRGTRRRGNDVHRRCHADQGGQCVQVALRRPLHDGGRATDHGGCRPRPPGRALDVGRLLARGRRFGRERHYRSQYFDKVVAWGGGDAINNVIKYTGPGFHLVSFDPKVSMSIIGREAFACEEVLGAVADLAASDATVFNQDACVASRHMCVEGSIEQVDRFCELLCQRMAVERQFASARGPKPPLDVREASRACAGSSRTSGSGAPSTARASSSARLSPSTSTRRTRR